MALDPVTEIANAVGTALGIGKTLIDDAVEQKYDSEFKERLSNWNNIVADNDPNKRADAMQSYSVRVTSDAGSPAEGVGPIVGTPLDTLTSLFAIAAAKIKQDAILNQMLHKIPSSA